MWILFALLNPISESFRNVFSKKASRNNADPLVISWFNNFIPVIVYSPFLFFIETKFSFLFFKSIIISGIINIVAVILYHRAINKGEISTVVPMLSFTPLFLLVISPLIVNEFPDLLGMVGLILIVIGSYLLNINPSVHGFFTPLKSLVKNKGTRYMLIVSFIWAISANYDKIGIQQSSPLQYIIFVNLFVFTGVSSVLFFKKKAKLIKQAKENKHIIYVGLFTALGFIFQMTALSLTLVAYVISLKRMSGMITVFFGAIFFKEQNIREKMLGSLIMFLGVLLILLPF